MIWHWSQIKCKEKSTFGQFQACFYKKQQPRKVTYTWSHQQIQKMATEQQAQAKMSKVTRGQLPLLEIPEFH
jgi:hypothetical protein